MVVPFELNALIKEQIKKQYPHGSTGAQKAYRKLLPVSDGEEALWYQLTNFSSLPRPEREQKLISDRKWRYDFVWKPQKIVAEIEGAAGYGRHTRYLGFAEDCYKYNAATLLGYRVFRFTPRMVYSGETLGLLQLALDNLACRTTPEP